MKITEIKLAGSAMGKALPEFFATVSRAENDDYISVTLHTDKGDIKHRVLADDEDDFSRWLSACRNAWTATPARIRTNMDIIDCSNILWTKQCERNPKQNRLKTQNLSAAESTSRK